MELTPYLEGLRRDLAAAAAAGGDVPGRRAAGGSLGARLCLLEALSDAAAEITTKLDPGERRGATSRPRGPARRRP